MNRAFKRRNYGPKKNVFDDGPYTTHTSEPTQDGKRFVVVNKRGNYVQRYAVPEDAVAAKERLNFKHAEWIMLKP